MGRQVKKIPSAGPSAETITRLAGQRRRMILLELGYFILLLVVGTMVFWMNIGGSLILTVVVLALAAYIFLVRPMNRSYLAELRKVLLKEVVCGRLEDVSYASGSGVGRELVDKNGFFPMSNYPLRSREYLCGRQGGLEAEMADVTFPFSENGRNAMFNGVFLHIHWQDSGFSQTVVRAGVTETQGVSKQVLDQVNELGSFIPGSLYLRAEDDDLYALLRGRLLGISLNPLMAVNERTMNANIFPELDQAIRLAQLLRLERRGEK